jgi:hypothetical protein
MFTISFGGPEKKESVGVEDGNYAKNDTKTSKKMGVTRKE